MDNRIENNSTNSNEENKNFEKHLAKANLEIKKLKYILCSIITLVLCFTGFGFYNEMGGIIGAVIGLGISAYINP